MQSDLLSVLLYEESSKPYSTASSYETTLAAADQAHVNMQIRIMI